MPRVRPLHQVQKEWNAQPRIKLGVEAARKGTVTRLSAQSQPLAGVDHLIAADLQGDGQFELFATNGAELRWGEWRAGAAKPSFQWSYIGEGLLASLSGQGSRW